MWHFVMGRSGAGAGFSPRKLRFPLPIYIPSVSPQSSSLSPEAGTVDQEWPQCQYPHKPELKKNSYARAVCQKNAGSVKFKQSQIKIGGRTVYRTLLPKRAPFQTGIDWWPHLRKVPRRRRISHTHPVWLWGHSLFKISSPGPVFYRTKWLLWRPPLNKILHLIRIVALIKGQSKGEAQ
jgi:hypothetical protein